MKRSVPVVLLILLAVLGCSFGSLLGQAPAPTPTPTRTLMPTFTAIPTDTPTPLVTPSPTNTRVVPTATPMPTLTPTFTPVPPTPILPPPAATPTPKPPTATPTPSAPTATPTPSVPYKGHAPWYEPNCGNTWIEGRVVDRDGTTGLNGVLVKLWAEGGFTFDLFPSGKWSDHPLGFYEFTIGGGYPRAGSWYIALVDAGGGLISDVITFQTTADCDSASGRQKVVVDFAKQ